MLNKKNFMALFLVPVIFLLGCTTTTQTLAQESSSEKVFYMDSFTVVQDGKYYPQYSIKELTVRVGEKVKIYVNATSGMHDFNIDEFNVHSETPTGEVTLIEFIADKKGEFIYYCSKPGHRANGHWGTLRVVE